MSQQLSTICDGYHRVVGIVVHATRRRRLWQEQSNPIFVFRSEARVCPDHIFTARAGITHLVFGLPLQLSAPFCLRDAVNNYSCVLNRPLHLRPFHLSRTSQQQGKESSYENKRDGEEHTSTQAYCPCRAAAHGFASPSSHANIVTVVIRP